MKSKAAVRQAFDFLPGGFTSSEQFQSKLSKTRFDKLSSGACAGAMDVEPVQTGPPQEPSEAGPVGKRRDSGTEELWRLRRSDGCGACPDVCMGGVAAAHEVHTVQHTPLIQSRPPQFFFLSSISITSRLVSAGGKVFMPCHFLP